MAHLDFVCGGGPVPSTYLWEVYLTWCFLKLFQVNPGSKAEKAGIREGDIITEINAIAVSFQEEAKRLQKASEDGLHLKLIQ